MRKCVLVGLAVLALAVVLVVGRGLNADEPQTPNADLEASLKGKVIAVTTRHTDKSGGVLEKVSVRRLGGRTFLVGLPADDGKTDNPYRGVNVTVWIPLEDVVQLLEFNTVEDARKVYEQPAK